MPSLNRCSKVSDEQKDAMEAMKSKFDGLTDEQKAEIYVLNDQKATIESQIIDKYLEFGIIDLETAESLKQNIKDKAETTRTEGKMPVLGKAMRGSRNGNSEKNK